MKRIFVQGLLTASLVLCSGPSAFSQGLQPIAKHVSVEWQTAPLLDSPSERQSREYWGAYAPGDRGAGRDQPDLRIEELRITVDGKVARIPASMYADLTNPNPASIQTQIGSEAIHVRFEGSQTSAAYVVTVTVITTPWGPRVLKRRVCSKPIADSCLETVNAMFSWE
jgi:hypothetical protein